MTQSARAHAFIGEECLQLTAELHQARLQVLRLRRALAAGSSHPGLLARSLESWMAIQASRMARLRLFAQRHGLAEPDANAARVDGFFQYLGR